ncbi:MAG TPA: YwiC-like family protein [Micromonosporaceae bacterium]|nr:YwiC-like family protein [Micromonosporaceae bacterium]
MSAPVTAARPASAPPPRRRLRQLVPPQHGAWAMLLLPFLAALTVTGWHWLHAPLLGAWLAGYLGSYYALQAVKTRRPGRFRTPLLLYAAVAVPLVALVVTARPAVLLYAPGYALLVAVNAGYAWRRRERALANDLASVAQSCLIVLVAGTVAAVPPRALLGVLAVMLLYFTGTVLYVKTMIRERGSVAYRRASVAYHVVALGAAAWLSLPVAAVFALLLARAWLLPGRSLAPRHVGLIEIGNCLLLLVAVAAGLA